MNTDRRHMSVPKLGQIKFYCKTLISEGGTNWSVEIAVTAAIP